MSLQITPNTALSEWSEDWIKQILNQDLEEGYLHEFKSDISSKDQDLCKSISSFANTQGGFIIFGIHDAKNKTGWDRLCGVRNSREFAKTLSDCLGNGKTVPTIFFPDPKFITLSHEGTKYQVAVVKIDSSEFKPHAVVMSDGLLRFWVRNNQTATAMTYPVLTKTIEESTQLRNWLAALYLDAEYIRNVAGAMLIPEGNRSNNTPVNRINSLISSDQWSQVISLVPNDALLVGIIWRLRAQIDHVNSLRDLMWQRHLIPPANVEAATKEDNDSIASVVPAIIGLSDKLREHLVEKYPRIREWLGLAQKL